MKRFAGRGNSKYGANKVVVNGILFDSKYEGERYLYLLDLEKQGKISELHRQVRFILIPKTTKLAPKLLKTKVRYERRTVEMQADYHADFVYKEGDVYVCEEFKSQMTAKLADYILRRKLMVKKIYEHNKKKHSQWVFREVVYVRKNKTIITDK